MGEPVTRQEFDMLRQMVTSNGRAIGNIGGLSVQMTEVIKDVNDVKADLTSFRRDHTAAHDREQSARIIARRWAIATFIAAVAAIETPLIILLAHIR